LQKSPFEEGVGGRGGGGHANTESPNLGFSGTRREERNIFENNKKGTEGKAETYSEERRQEGVSRKKKNWIKKEGQ